MSIAQVRQASSRIATVQLLYCGRQWEFIFHGYAHAKWCSSAIAVRSHFSSLSAHTTSYTNKIHNKYSPIIQLHVEIAMR